VKRALPSIETAGVGIKHIVGGAAVSDEDVTLGADGIRAGSRRAKEDCENEEKPESGESPKEWHGGCHLCRQIL
jgi:hypothetical protein